MAIIENPQTIEDYQNNVKEYQQMYENLSNEKEELNSKVQSLTEDKLKIEEDLKRSRDLVSEYAFKIVADYRPPQSNDINKGKSEGENNQPTIKDILNKI